MTTLAEMLAERGLHTAASVDTPYYLRDGMNYDRGFQSFFMNRGQDTLWSLTPSARLSQRSPGRPRCMAIRIGPKRAAHIYDGHPVAGAALQGGLLPLRRHLGPPRALGRAFLLHGALLAGLRRRAGAAAVRELARRAGIRRRQDA